jgi:hypothetical protein
VVLAVFFYAVETLISPVVSLESDLRLELVLVGAAILVQLVPSWRASRPRDGVVPEAVADPGAGDTATGTCTGRPGGSRINFGRRGP